MRIVFIGFAHRWNGPRLYYREIHTLKQAWPNLEIYWIGGNRSAYPDRLSASDELFAQFIFYPEGDVEKDTSYYAGLSRISRKAKKKFWELRQAIKLQPDIVQASDIREILYAIMIKALTGCSLVYDSHEDYFNQVYEYNERTLSALIKATGYQLIELLFLRFFDAVFCTDEFLIQKYSHRRYGIPKVYLLRNFVNLQLIEKRCRYESTNHLRLVYAGGINEFRGVRECAEFVHEFNHRFSPERSLSFHVYGPNHIIVQDLVRQGLINYHGWVDYPNMLEQLANYDIGICLWHRIRKHERNLPIKNFEYMAVGLPIITSNFGNLQRYVRDVRSGYCIDPVDYSAFEEAILNLFDVNTRECMGVNGRNYTRTKASFQSESEEYIRLFTGEL